MEKMIENVEKPLDNGESGNIITKQASKQASKHGYSCDRFSESHEKLSGQSESILHVRDKSCTSGNGLQRPTKNIVYALNPYPNGVCRTIKAQYEKNGLANFVRQDGFGASAVLEMTYG